MIALLFYFTVFYILPDNNIGPKKSGTLTGLIIDTQGKTVDYVIPHTIHKIPSETVIPDGR